MYGIVEILLGWREQDYELPLANQPKTPQLRYLTKHMVLGFCRNHMCFFLSVLKKTQNTLHIYSMCGGIKTLKHNLRTMLQLPYHDCKNLTHTSNTRPVKRTEMVVTVRFTIRVLLTFSDW